MRYIFTIWLPVGIVLTIIYLLGSLRWYSLIIVFMSNVVGAFVGEYYLSEKWRDPHGWHAYNPKCYWKLLQRMWFARLGSTTTNGHWFHYYNYWKLQNLQSLGIFRVHDIVSHFRRQNMQDVDLSPLVASGEIKSTGTSVSVDDVIAKIDAQLEMESE